MLRSGLFSCVLGLGIGALPANAGEAHNVDTLSPATFAAMAAAYDEEATAPLWDRPMISAYVAVMLPQVDTLPDWRLDQMRGAYDAETGTRSSASR